MPRSKLIVRLLLGIVVLACAEAAQISAAETKHQSATVLTVKKLCCSSESGPAIKELSKVPGVGRVSVDYKPRCLMIEPAAKGVISPRAVWEAAERVKVGPLRLATAEGVHTSKPRR